MGALFFIDFVGYNPVISAVRIGAPLTHIGYDPQPFLSQRRQISLPLGPPSEDSRNSQTHSPSLTEFSEIIIIAVNLEPGRGNGVCDLEGEDCMRAWFLAQY